MFVFIAIFALVCIWQIKLKPAGNAPYMTDYMSVDNTTAIKGIFIIMVFFSHFNSYVDFTNEYDLVYYAGFKQISQRMVTLFLLYSGYGVMESIKKKKMAYVHRIPVNRVAGTYFKFIIAVILFLILHLVLNDGTIPYSKHDILLSGTAWTSVGNSNWYILTIVICYVLTFIAFEIFRDKLNYIPSVALLTVLMVAFVAYFHFTELRPTRYYNTALCYLLGVYLSLFKDKFDRLFGRHNTIWAVTFCASWITTYLLWSQRERFYKYEICMFTFALAIVLLTMRVTFKNKILIWFGKHLFSVFILQRLPMIALKKVGIADQNIYIYFILCFATTIVLAFVFDLFVDPIWHFISNSKKYLKKKA